VSRCAYLAVLFLGSESDSLLILFFLFTQATLYKMAQRIIAENASVNSVSYALPNKHYVPVDMRYLDIDNLTPYVVFLLLPSLVSFLYINEMG